jgi:hypothetical protein
VSRRKPRDSAARRRWLVVLALVTVFLTFGVPRWLAGDDAPVGSDADANFSKVCRQHGGTPRTAPGAGTSTEPQHFCTVRYVGRVYRMDAITPNGFDEDTARFQRQGCEQARSEQSATARGQRRESFIYHADTGVCERRP